ncbi:MAG: hypothetical protein A2V98_19920 [Planctomycetes bacterium RBG_16_64_12]|nr:MAG: hypothetical protein A2V98_19920 [Planctomycetes bacterium RBG_16_64_12]
MADASDIYGVVFKNGSATFLARVVGALGTPVTQANVASAKYTAYLLDENDPDTATAITGHTGVAVPIASLVYDSLQNDDLWDVDDTGYNFKHVLNVTANQAFAAAGRTYRVVFELTPTAGQVILVRFRVHAI